MDYRETIKNMMSEYRYKHSIGVMETAQILANKYGADENKAVLAGLLHDCVKDLPKDEYEKLIKEYKIDIDEITMAEPKLMHAIIGAYYVRNVFRIDDDEIFDAIYYHTTGKKNMSLLTKIIYLADYIEPNRNFNGVEKIRNIAETNLDKAVLYELTNTIVMLGNKCGLIHPDTINARNYYIMKGYTL